MGLLNMYLVVLEGVCICFGREKNKPSVLQDQFHLQFIGIVLLILRSLRLVCQYLPWALFHHTFGAGSMEDVLFMGFTSWVHNFK